NDNGVFFFFFVYVFCMTSPGDVKLFGTIGSVVANMKVITMAIFFYALIQMVMAIYSLTKACQRVQLSTWAVLKQDIICYVTKTGSLIQPIYFPCAIVMGLSVIVSQLVELV